MWEDNIETPVEEAIAETAETPTDVDTPEVEEDEEA